MKIAYIGIDLFYPALIALEQNGCEIAKIFTCKTDNITEFNTQIIKYAKVNNIPYTLSRITREDIEEIINMGVNAVICGGYYYLIPVDDRIPMVNIHPTFLPLGRGAWPMPQLIMGGYEKSGVTMHKIAEKFDTGDIILQKSFLLDRDETHETYMEKVYKLLPVMIKELLDDFDRLYSCAIPQGEGEYWECLDEHSYVMSEDTDIKEADLILRAFYGYECLYKIDDRMISVIKGRAVIIKREGYVYYPVRNGYIEVEK